MKRQKLQILVYMLSCQSLILLRNCSKLYTKFYAGNKMKLKILVVDDERVIVNSLKIYLESDNYKVIEAYTGDGAIRALRSEVPDLILLDLMLPDITGSVSYTHLRAHETRHD